MATLKEIESKIQEHEKSLIILNEKAVFGERIRVVNALIEFWKNQKKKAIRIEERLKIK